MKVEAGSDDRDICKKYMRDKNFEVLRRRIELETKIAELETEKKSLEELYQVIKRDWDGEIALWRLNNPDVEPIRLL